MAEVKDDRAVNPALAPLFRTFGCEIAAKEKPLASLTRREVHPLLVEHGALLFRGFNPDLVQFKEFTDRCCLKHMTHMGVSLRARFAQFEGDETLTEVTMGENALALHGEMYHSPGAPEIIWFFCVEPAPLGGATTIADGNELYNGISAGLRKLFEASRLRYKHIDPPQVWEPRFGLRSIDEVVSVLEKSEGVRGVKTDGKSNIHYDYVVSAVHPSRSAGKLVFINNIFIARNPANRLKDGMLTNPAMNDQRAIEVEFEDGSPITDEMLEEVSAAGARVTHDIDWRPGDILMVDNTRVLHGRRAFRGRRVIATRIAAIA